MLLNTSSQSKFTSLSKVSMKNEMYFTHVLKGSYVPLVVVISYLLIGVQRFDQSLLYQKYAKHFFSRLPHVFCIPPWDNYLFGRVPGLLHFPTGQDNALHTYSSILMCLFRISTIIEISKLGFCEKPLDEFLHSKWPHF